MFSVGKALTTVSAAKPERTAKRKKCVVVGELVLDAMSKLHHSSLSTK